MKHTTIWTTLLFLSCIQFGCQPQSLQTSHGDRLIEAKIDTLLAQMTLEEKVGQMSQVSKFGEDGPGDIENEVRKGNVGSFLNISDVQQRNALQKIAVEESRLGIPLIFGYDVIHGYRTVFPVPLAEAATWNMDLLETTAAIAAKEARSVGIDWTFAPMIDIARDPRWAPERSHRAQDRPRSENCRRVHGTFLVFLRR